MMKIPSEHGNVKAEFPIIGKSVGRKLDDGKPPITG